MIADIEIDALISHSIMRSEALMPLLAARPWTNEENLFIAANIGWLTDAEMGTVLNRSEVAVHIHWERELNLFAPSKAPDVITGHEAARALGVDGHAVCGWIDAGLIPGRLMAGDRKIRLVQRVTFMRWSVAPENWIYFHINRVKDPHLKRLIDLRSARWGDEWWPTRRVAEYHGVTTQEIKRYIKLGRIHATQAQYSVGGRHADRYWSYWFVLKSEATRPDLIFHTRESAHRTVFTPRAQAWLFHARDDLKLQWAEIVRTMKLGYEKPWALARHYHLLKDGKR